jgi:hypothetical protein
MPLLSTNEPTEICVQKERFTIPQTHAPVVSWDVPVLTITVMSAAVLEDSTVTVDQREIWDRSSSAPTVSEAATPIPKSATTSQPYHYRKIFLSHQELQVHLLSPGYVQLELSTTGRAAAPVVS